MAQLRSILSSVVLGIFLAACGGSDGPTDPGGNDGGGNGGGDPRTILDNPSFSSDVMEIFTRNGCTASGCHGSGEGGLTMGNASTTHANLVNVPSAAVPSETRVIPGDAANSYLVKKLNGSAQAGQQMPLNGTPLDNIDMTNIQNWINQGAQNN